MNRNGWTLRSIIGLLVALIAIAVLIWRTTYKSKVATTQPETTVYEPECPDHDLRLPAVGNDTTPLTIVPLAGDITNVPEFHDCQRMIATDDSMAYGPLIGIWVAESLDLLPDSLAKLNPGVNLVPTTVPTPSSGGVASGNATAGTVTDSQTMAAPPGPGVRGVGLAFAEVYSWDGTYDHLGISVGWNCLYVFPAAAGSQRYAALMVPEEDPHTCLGPVKADSVSALPGVKPLYVFTESFNNLGPGDYPAVGRWSWDPGNKVQYIGLGCHDSWCEVTDQPNHVSSPSWDPGTGEGHRGRRVWQVKGWFDRQRLAIERNGQLQPAVVWGTVVPDSDLGTRTHLSDFRNTTPGADPWVHVALAALSRPSTEYLAKFGLIPGTPPDHAPPQRWANISLCTGTEQECFPQGGAPTPCPSTTPGSGWWARIAAPGRTDYRCVKYTSHAGLGRTIPGTARWFWVNTDEKLWVACADGCCQLQ